jgi:hypothetical protein
VELAVLVAELAAERPRDDRARRPEAVDLEAETIRPSPLSRLAMNSLISLPFPSSVGTISYQVKWAGISSADLASCGPTKAFSSLASWMLTPTVTSRFSSGGPEGSATLSTRSPMSQT